MPKCNGNALTRSSSQNHNEICGLPPTVVSQDLAVRLEEIEILVQGQQRLFIRGLGELGSQPRKSLIHDHEFAFCVLSVPPRVGLIFLLLNLKANIIRQ